VITDYLTFDDLVQHVALRYNLVLQHNVQAHVSVGVREGYRRLFAQHPWNYLRRFETVHLNPPQTDGTIAYDHATRTVTLTDATWPSDVEFGDITIGGKLYQIQYSPSSTTIVLEENSNPGDDVAAGTSYTWTQRRVLLSWDVGDIYEIIESDHTIPMSQVDVRQAFWLTESYVSQTFPRRYTIFPSQSRPGQHEIWFPQSTYSTSHTVNMVYEAKRRPLTIEHIDGIELSTTGTAVTFPAGTLTSEHVGCVVRISSDTNMPTSRTGRLQENSQMFDRHPFESERIIIAVNSATSAVMNAALDSDVSSRAWSLSQRCDVDSTAVQTLLLRLVECEYAKVAGLSGDVKGRADYEVQRALIDATTDDADKIRPGSGIAGAPLRLEDIGEIV